MNKSLFLSIATLSIFYTFSIAQTNIPAGLVSGTWTLANSPYNIQGSIQIPNGLTLTIEPGVTVNFQGTYKLNVQGRLLAIGTAANIITFTASNNTDGWRGIRFDNTPVANDSSKIVYCKIEYGKATGTSPNDNGGGVYFKSFSNAIVSNSSILNCCANNSGGAIFCQISSPIIENNIISSNSANWGGGISFDNGNSAIINNVFTNNTATSGGGAIYCSNGSPSISNNYIFNNNSVNSGGGITCGMTSTPLIFNNIIANNSANNGGGIACHPYCTPIIFNNTITNNKAINGGAFYSEQGANPTFRNTIFWGNIATLSGAQIFLNDEASDPNFYYCNIQGGTSGFGLNGNFYSGDYSNNIDADPKFVSPSAGSGAGFDGITANWSLQSTSPCIDAGDINGIYPEKDIVGNPRVNICRVDMGAYEYQKGVSFVVSLSISQPINCNGEATGEITATATGGTAPYSYLWSNGQTTSKSTGLIAGNYSVTVSDAGGCSITKSIAISEPPKVSIDAGQDKTIACGSAVQLQAKALWQPLKSGITDQLNSVFFINADTGYAVGVMGAILKTTDGGAIWEKQISGTTRTLLSVHFVDANIGYVVGNYDSGCDCGTILKTTNGGETWSRQASGTLYNLNSVFFTSSDTGYVATIYGSILKTINGGLNWTAQTSGTSEWLNSVYFVDANTGYAVGANGTILKTTNGGINWTAQTSYTNNNLYSVYFTDLNTGYAVGTSGKILKTTNAGLNWITQSSGTNYWLFSVRFANANSGYAVGSYGTILKTTNGGTNWILQSSGIIQDLYSVCYASENRNYAVGMSSSIIKFTEPVSYSWFPANGLNSTNMSNPIANPNATTSYIVTATTANGCIAKDTVKVTVSPLIATADDVNVSCGSTSQLNVTTNYTGTGNLTYTWSPSTGLSATNIANPVVNLKTNGEYSVQVSTPNSCVATDNVKVTASAISFYPSICMVTVNENDKNVVVWQREQSTAIDSFFVYRESSTQTGQYDLIGKLPYSTTCEFIDNNSNVRVQSNKYKISVKDVCGFFTNKSAEHKTMHLTINKGMGNNWNLIWEPYLGVTVSSYNIYRGTNKDNLILIGNTSGSNTTYTDETAPSVDVYYQVEISMSMPCTNLKLSGYTSSRSNIVRTSDALGIRSVLFDEPMIYPNPASDKITIKNLHSLNTTIMIIDLNGRQMMDKKIETEQIDISILPKGVYLIKLIDSGHEFIYKLSKE